MNRGRRRVSIFPGDDDYVSFPCVLEEGWVIGNVSERSSISRINEP